jgi:hypothetical protein
MALRAARFVAKPWKIFGAFFQGFFPGERDDCDGDDQFEQGSHGG